MIELGTSTKAETLKMWIASLGKERIDEVIDTNGEINYYRKKGYLNDWIEVRLKGILDRKKK